MLKPCGKQPLEGEAQRFLKERCAPARAVRGFGTSFVCSGSERELDGGLGCWKGWIEGLGCAAFRIDGNTASRAYGWTPGKTAGNIATRRDGRSTGVQRTGDKPVADALGDFAEGFTSSAGMAADLAVIEDQRQRIGQHPNHGEDHQRSGFGGRRDV